MKSVVGILLTLVVVVSLGTGRYERASIPYVSNVNGTLTDEEKSMLLFVLEEEKLAVDVFNKLYMIWKHNIFQNMAESEKTHFEAVKSLLDAYNVEYDVPATSGIFNNADLQKLYNVLVEKGSESIEKALEVGATIEEKCIYDLEKYLKKTDNPYIRMVFEFLVRRSENHLKAFDSQLYRYTGEHYTLTYITKERFESILSSSTSPGRGMGTGNGPRRGR